jgi:peptidoglycan hydrolase-like protein with peptidoglycan-binding domain
MPTVKKGSKGLVVARLQNVLTHGAPGQWKTTPGPIDEKFGPKTKACVEAFQRWAGIPANGVVDARTWAVPIPSMDGTLETVVSPESALR